MRKLFYFTLFVIFIGLSMHFTFISPKMTVSAQLPTLGPTECDVCPTRIPTETPLIETPIIPYPYPPPEIEETPFPTIIPYPIPEAQYYEAPIAQNISLSTKPKKIAKDVIRKWIYNFSYRVPFIFER